MVRPLTRSNVLPRPARTPSESRPRDLGADERAPARRGAPPVERDHAPTSASVASAARHDWLHALADDHAALVARMDRLPLADAHAELGFLVPRVVDRLRDLSLEPTERDTHLRLLALIGTPHARSALASSLDTRALPARSTEVLRAQLQAAVHSLLGVDETSLYGRLEEVVRAIGDRGVAGEVREAASALAVLGRHPDLRARAARLLREELGLTHDEPLAAGSLALAAHALQLDEREALTSRARPRLRALGSPAAMTLERELAARTVERGSVLAFFLGRRSA